MSVFDLLFLLVVLATGVSLLTAVVLAVAGRRSASVRILLGLGVSVALYLVVGVGVSYFEPQRVFAVGEPWCFDDWCLTVERVTISPSSGGRSYDVDLRLSSRARRATQRARGAWVFLIDGRGRRYAPDVAGSAIPLDATLAPGESLDTSRSFHVPEGVRPVGLITGHGGPYCGAMSFLIIGGSGCLFHKPPMIRLSGGTSASIDPHSGPR